ncbi:hypothetical protein [Mycolicibacterium diernhoferi]|uniref:hypothetical protein n=1 Tax=Mycolicibacterium diernhoferi TaxID=1801 RepID=UPI0013F59B86|nr:hypothetical protein [Mycolicibacterium diernhoferi]
MSGFSSSSYSADGSGFGGLRESAAAIETGLGVAQLTMMRCVTPLPYVIAGDGARP